MSNNLGVTDRSLFVQAIVEATKKVWSAAARLERDEERQSLAELSSLIAEYQRTYHAGAV